VTDHRYIVDYIIVLKRLEALPPSLVDHVEFLDCRGRPLDSIATVNPAPVTQAQSWNLLSYFWSSGPPLAAADASPLPTTTASSAKDSAREFGSQLQLPDIFRMLRSAHEACVEAAFHSLLTAAENQLAAVHTSTRDATHEVCLLLTEVMGYVATTNLEKLGSLQRYFEFLKSVIAVAPRPSALLERAVSDIMSVAVQSCGESVGVPSPPLVAATLELVQGLPSEVSILLSDVISVGVGKMMGTFTCNLNRRNWEALFSILNSLISDGRSMLHCWDGIEHIVRDSPLGFINSVNLDLCLMTLRLLLDQGRHMAATPVTSPSKPVGNPSTNVTRSMVDPFIAPLKYLPLCPGSCMSLCFTLCPGSGVVARALLPPSRLALCVSRNQRCV
jgi:hypothetical protein